MRSHLYPTFAVDHENFEKALPVALGLSQKLNMPCRYWKTGDYYVIAFKDQAINRGFYYTHKHEQEMISVLENHIDFHLVYTKEEKFQNGKKLS
ncbi:hypothetical protein [Desulfofalx alkaliphila]|uniref:hypothetical protein n=1 Tax=Desulfofalx alkaliphila TaxID=105483 RepID=UPI0004E170F5|nr:hypothetical protein [Desulfofalx alkaliphila]